MYQVLVSSVAADHLVFGLEDNTKTHKMIKDTRYISVAERYNMLREMVYSQYLRRKSFPFALNDWDISKNCIQNELFV